MSVAGVAHPVERHLAKVEVASSSLVTRSIRYRGQVVRQESAKLSFASSNLAGTSKKLQAFGLEFFSYIRLGRVILSVPVIFASQVILPDGSWGEYNITSAQAEISLSRKAQYHYEVISLSHYAYAIFIS